MLSQKWVHVDLLLKRVVSQKWEHADLFLRKICISNLNISVFQNLSLFDSGLFWVHDVLKNKHFCLRNKNPDLKEYCLYYRVTQHCEGLHSAYLVTLNLRIRIQYFAANNSWSGNRNCQSKIGFGTIIKNWKCWFGARIVKLMYL